jgi:O-antigen ligase
MLKLFPFYFFPLSLILGNLMININIFYIIILIFIKSINDQNFNWVKNKYFKILIIIYFYLIINSLYNFYLDPSVGASGIIRSLGFIKFIFLTLSFTILIKDKKELEKILYFWSVIIIFVIFDVYFEFIFDQNILGFKSLDQTRIVSFFYDEMVVGAYLLTFSYIIFSYQLEKKNKYKHLFIFFIILIPVTIMVTGERSNFIKSVIIFTMMILTIDKSYFPIKKIGLIFITIISISLIIFANKTIFLKQTELFKRIMIVKDNVHFFEKFQNIKYIQHYKLAIDIFNDHKIFGVGNKNFRFKCHDEKYYDKNVMKFNYDCSTHPHQLHFEILSEQGIIGYLLILYFFIIFFRNFIKNISKDNILYNSINIYLIIFLIPLLPSGSIFSTFNGSLFWLIFSVAFLFNEKKLNF